MRTLSLVIDLMFTSPSTWWPLVAEGFEAQKTAQSSEIAEAPFNTCRDWTRVDDLVSIRIINKLRTIAKYRDPMLTSSEMKSWISWPKKAALRLRPLIMHSHIERFTL
ncbi:hypothetical protein TNCV_3370561 [Trichonephila clavipes]|nr:hypothetical protein TNCV_3370561 [Trichonephila clavipes]